jgi:hypothetical protein
MIDKIKIYWWSTSFSTQDAAELEAFRINFREWDFFKSGFEFKMFLEKKVDSRLLLKHLRIKWKPFRALEKVKSKKGIYGDLTFCWAGISGSRHFSIVKIKLSISFHWFQRGRARNRRCWHNFTALNLPEYHPAWHAGYFYSN